MKATIQHTTNGNVSTCIFIATCMYVRRMSVRVPILRGEFKILDAKNGYYFKFGVAGIA